MLTVYFVISVVTTLSTDCISYMQHRVIISSFKPLISHLMYVSGIFMIMWNWNGVLMLLMFLKKLVVN